MGRKVFVVGVGMTKFEKPGARPDWDYPDMVREAVTAALADASLRYDAIEQAFIGYCAGESTSGQRALYEVGLTGIPVFNVNNNCATGSSAIFLGKQLVEGGMAECVLAAGFEKMNRGSPGAMFLDRTLPVERHFTILTEERGMTEAPVAAQIFGSAGREHMERFGTTAEHFLKIAEKNHRHSTRNPYAQFQEEYTLDEVKAAPVVFDPLTRLACCPTSDGAGAAILASEAFVRDHGLEAQAVEVAGMAVATDRTSTFEGRSVIKLVGVDMTSAAAAAAYEQSGLGPEDVDVIELHDCFATNELLTYEALGLCEEGAGGELIDSGAVTYGGNWVVNPSGGLISKGHPFGATGLAQCAELAWQVRGDAGARQVAGARVALQHNIGLGGAAVVAIYRAPALT
jgi:acetyl-CoA acetyltransferase